MIRKREMSIVRKIIKEDKKDGNVNSKKDNNGR